MSDDFDKTDAKPESMNMKHASKSPPDTFPFDPGIDDATVHDDKHDEAEKLTSLILSFGHNPKHFSPRPPVSEYASRMFYFRAADQLLFSRSQPQQLQNYVICWGGRPLQLPFRNLFYNYYTLLIVSQKWMGASSSTKNLLMSLKKRNLALKVIEMMMMNPLMKMY